MYKPIIISPETIRKWYLDKLYSFAKLEQNFKLLLSSISYNYAVMSFKNYPLNILVTNDFGLLNWKKMCKDFEIFLGFSSLKASILERFDLWSRIWAQSNWTRYERSVSKSICWNKLWEWPTQSGIREPGYSEHRDSWGSENSSNKGSSSFFAFLVEPSFLSFFS